MSPTKPNLDELRIDRSDTPPRTSGTARTVLILLLLGIGAGLLWWFARPQTTAVRTFTVQATSPGSGTTLLNASGYVTARREATVSSKVTGKVMEVLVEEGMKVEAGQVLARLDSSNVEKNLHLAKARADSARTALDEIKANLEQAERELGRITQLEADQIASASELDQAEASAKALRARLARQVADVAVSEGEVAVWMQQMEDTIIRAPFAGIVVSKNAQPGEMISPVSAGGGFTRTGICTIVDMNSLEIEVDVSESYINRVQGDQPVQATLDSYPDWQIPAKVIAIIPTADRQKATVKVRVGFEQLDPRILPEMSVKVAFQSGDESPAPLPGITIPKSALQRRDGQDVVWVVRAGRVERRAVRVGPAQDDQITVLAGLSSGEKVVIEGPENLADTTSVTEAKP